MPVGGPPGIALITRTACATTRARANEWVGSARRGPRLPRCCSSRHPGRYNRPRVVSNGLQGAGGGVFSTGPRRSRRGSDRLPQMRRGRHSTPSKRARRCCWPMATWRSASATRGASVASDSLSPGSSSITPRNSVDKREPESAGSFWCCAAATAATAAVAAPPPPPIPTVLWPHRPQAAEPRWQVFFHPQHVHAGRVCRGRRGCPWRGVHNRGGSHGLPLSETEADFEAYQGWLSAAERGLLRRRSLAHMV
eukprot:COSAG02_NODE_463_length_21833_cov_11.529539_10_plen_252_part_00